MEKARVQAYLQSACSVLNFEIGEIWVCRDSSHQEGGQAGSKRWEDLRFIQLYTSPEYEKYRPKLVEASDVPDEHDVEKHCFSPLVCEAVREARQVVWAHTRHEDGLLGRSDLPLRTALGAPICSIGFDLCILLMFSPAVLELTEESHRFLFTVAQAASDAVCGFLPDAVSSPVSSPATLSNNNNQQHTAEQKPSPAVTSTSNIISINKNNNNGAAGTHTKALIEALPSAVTFQMVDMISMTINQPIKTEFMKSFNSIYNPSPPPLLPVNAPPSASNNAEGGGENNNEMDDMFDQLPPLEECFLPQELVEGGFIDNMEDDWDFGAALDFIFDKESKEGGGVGSSGSGGPSTGHEWFNTKIGDRADGKAGQELADDSPLKFFYEDALQRLRFEEFVKGFLSMSVFHTAECWVARGNDSLEQVYCATCLADIQSWVHFSTKLHAENKRAIPTRISMENRAIWEKDLERLNGSIMQWTGSKGHFIQTAFGLPVPIDKKNRLIVIFYSTFSVEPASLMESFIKRALDLLWNKDAPVPPMIPPSMSGGGSEEFTSPVPGLSSSADDFTSLVPGLRSREVDSDSNNSLSTMGHQHQQQPWSSSPPSSVAASGGGGGKGGYTPPSNNSNVTEDPSFGDLSDLPPLYPVCDMDMSRGSEATGPPLYLQPKIEPRSFPSAPRAHAGGYYYNQQQQQQMQMQHQHNQYNPSTLPIPQQQVHPSYISSQQAQHQQPPAYISVGQQQQQSSGGKAFSTGGYATQPTYGQPLAVYYQHHQSSPSTMPPPLVNIGVHPQFIPPSGAPININGTLYYPQPSPPPPPPPQQQQHQQQQQGGMPPLNSPPSVHTYSQFGATSHSPLTAGLSRRGGGSNSNSIMPPPPPRQPTSLIHAQPIPQKAAPPPNGQQQQQQQYFGVDPSTSSSSCSTSSAPASSTDCPPLVMVHQQQDPPMLDPPMLTHGGVVRPPHHPALVVSPQQPLQQYQQVPPRDGAATPDYDMMINGMHRNICKTDMCGQPTVKRSPYCSQHTGARHCQFPGCTKCAQGNTRFCIAHGGGRRCTYPGCTKGARDKNFCAAHGGGKRCVVEGCSKSAVGGSFMCTAHGGGRRCQYQDCSRSAQSSTNYCVRHGGGRKCQIEGCQKVARGRTNFCAAHGGGIRCKVNGCNKAAVGKFQMCRTHSGYPKKRAGEPISTTHFLDVNPTKKRLVTSGDGMPGAIATATGAATAMGMCGAIISTAGGYGTGELTTGGLQPPPPSPSSS